MSNKENDKIIETARESLLEQENEAGEECSDCRKRKLSVHDRANAYAIDVGNDLTARHVVCDECDYQNRMDI